MRLIDADALYERLKADEEIARDRVIDTPSSFPNGAVNPYAIRYIAQLNERTRFKEMVFDAPTIEPMRWIPCSERLPERSVEVLTYTAIVGFIEIQSLEQDGNGFLYWENQRGDRQDMTVTAWMPLPEPWKGDADEN